MPSPLIGLALILTAPAYAAPRYQLTEKGGGLGLWIDQTVLLHVRPGAGDDEDIWTAERRRVESNFCGIRTDKGCTATTISVHEQIDGRRCPALQVAMAALPAARDEYRRWAHDVMVTDTAEISLTALSVAGNVEEIQAEYIGPIEAWWHSSEAHIAQCWAAAPH